MTSTLPQFLSIAEELGRQKSLTEIRFRAKGAFKETFGARTSSDAVIALKILDPAKCDLSRSEREVEAMRKCDFEGIGKLFEFGSFTAADGRGYLYMLEEFFGGGTLADKLTQRLPPETVRAYGVFLTKALAHLKNLNLVHRDIKPENIMFGSPVTHPVLVDFGLVRDLSSSSLTQTWLPQGPGTPLFASPEQLTNKKQQIAWRSDQFSLGIVLGYCLTLKHPFAEDGMTIPQTISAVASYRKCCPVFCETVSALGFPNIVKMLEPWPVHRFLSAEDLLESFEV